MGIDLGKWLRDRKGEAVKQWQNSAVLDAVSANTQADQARRAQAGQPVQYADQQQQLSTQARANPVKRNPVEQFYNNASGGLIEFGAKIPGSLLDLKASVDRTLPGRALTYVNPATQTPALVNLVKDKIEGVDLGTNQDRFTKSMQKFGEGEQDFVQSKVDQSRFGQRESDNKWVAGGGRAIGNVGGQIATTIASGGSTVIPAVISGSQTFSQQRQAAADAGKSENAATGIGLLQGGVEAATEKIGLDKLKVPGGSNFVINTLKRFGTEGMQEGGQQFAQNLITNKTYNPNQGLKDGVAESAVFGGFAGGAAGAVFDIPSLNKPQNVPTGIPAQPGSLREKIQVAKERVSGAMNGNPDALPANQVIRNPTVFDAVMDKQKYLQNPNNYTTQELNQMNQVLFDAAQQTGIPFLGGSRADQAQTLAQFQEQNGEALQNPQPGTLRERIRNAKNVVFKPLNQGGYVQAPQMGLSPEAQIQANFDKLDRIAQAADQQSRNIDEARGIYREGNLPSSNEGSLLKAVDQKLEVPVPRKRLFKPLNEGGYAKNPFYKDKSGVTKGLSPEQSDFINQYANMLEDMGSGNGVSINPETGARMSSNYRDPSLGSENLTKAQWFDEAKRQIESGKAAYGASEDYKALPTQKSGSRTKAPKPPLQDLPSISTRIAQSNQAPKQSQLPQSQPAIQDGGTSADRSSNRALETPNNANNSTSSNLTPEAYANTFNVSKAQAEQELGPTFNAATKTSRGEDANKLAQAMIADKQLSDATREAQQSGKELNFFAKKDSNDRGVGIEQFDPKIHSIEAGFVVDKQGNVLGNHIKVDETGVQVNVGGDLVNMETIIGNPLDWGSKGTIDKTKKGRYKLSETMSRNIDNNAPTPEIANNTKRFLWSSKVKAEANMRTELVQEFKALSDRIKKTNKARPSNVTKEQYKDDIFAVLNGDKTDAQIRSEYDTKPAEAILTYKKETRTLYDSLLERINAERVKFGQAPIAPRQDYITHLQEMNQSKGFVTEVYGQMKNSFADEGMGKTRNGVPGDIAGRTEGFKPISKYNPFLQQRTGTKSLRDPFMAVQEYLQPALYNIHMTEPGARARAVEAAFRTAEQLKAMDSRGVAKDMETTLEKYKNASSDNSKLITGFQEYANAVAGKTQRFDRQVVDSSDAAAKGLRGWQGLQRIGGRGTILGNLSSVLAQPLNQVVGLADAGGINYAKGIAEYVGGNSEVSKSDFIRARETEATKPLRGKGEKVLDAGSLPLQAVEMASVKLMWHTQHQKALSNGYTGQEAVQQADINTERLVAGRGIADKPELYRSTLANGVYQYTLEVNAQNKAFWQDLDTKQKVKFMVAASATNALMGAITGFEPLPDFLKAIFETGQDFMDKNDGRDTAHKLAGGAQRLLDQYGSMNPLISGPANLLPQSTRKAIFGNDGDLGRYAGGSAPVQVIKNATNAATKLSKGDVKGAAEDAIRNVPFGNQIRKTAGGIGLLAKGYETDADGNPIYTAPTSPLGKAQVLAFGPNASRGAQNYYDEKSAGLTKDQREQLRDTPANKREEYKNQFLAQNAAADKKDVAKKDALKDPTSKTSSIAAINQASEDKTAALKASLSPDDYDIYNMTKEEKKKVVEAGIKTQAEMDGLNEYVKNKKNELGIKASTSVELPKNINQKARQILEDENSSDTEWLKKSNADTEVNYTIGTWLPQGVAKPPVNNATAKSWAELEKKRAEGTLGKLEEESTKKTILKNAYNSQLSEDEKDLYSLSKENLISAYDRGVINDGNIGKALAVEKQLFDAGLIASETLAKKLGLGARGYKGKSGGRKGSKATIDKSVAFSNSLQSSTLKRLNSLLAGTTSNRSTSKSGAVKKVAQKKIVVKG